MCVRVLSEGSVGHSDKSNVITVCCPPSPPPPSLSQQPSYKQGTAVVGWERPSEHRVSDLGEDIIFYRVFVDSKWQAEVKACAHCNKNGYQYMLSDLNPGQTYDVSVQAFAGQRRPEALSSSAFALCEGAMSASVPVTCSAPPNAPQLRLEGMDAGGIDVAWVIPQQYGDAQISVRSSPPALARPITKRHLTSGLVCRVTR